MRLLRFPLLLLTIITASCSQGGGGSDSSSNNENSPTLTLIEYDFFVDENGSIQANIGDSNISLVNISENPINGTANLINSVVSYSPNFNYFGLDRIVVTAIQNGKNVRVVLNINIIEQNIAPIANDVVLFVERGNGKFFDLDATDADSDVLSYELIGFPEYGTLSSRPLTSKTWGYDAPNIELTTLFTYRVFDGKQYSQTATVTINVTRPNVAPTFPPLFLENEKTGDNILIDEDTSFTKSFIASDLDGDIINATIKSQGVNGIATIQNNSNNSFVVNYVPSLNFFGTDSFVIELNDNIGGISSFTVPMSVLPVNDAPEVTESTISIMMNKGDFVGQLLDFGLTDVDNSSNELFILFDSPSTLIDLFYISSSKKVTATPKFEAEGSEVFFIRFSDGILTSNPISINVIIEGDPLPIITPINKNLNISQGDTLSFELEGNNTQDRNVIFSIVDYPQGGFSSVTGSLTSYVYTPPNNFYGSTQLTFKITDTDSGEESPLGFIIFDVLRTDFSNTWSIDFKGNLTENIFLKENSNYVIANRFFISNNIDTSIFSIFTENMMCGNFSDEYYWFNINSKDELYPFDRTENWFCFDNFYLLNEEIVEVSPKDIQESIYKELYFSNYFNTNEAFKFNQFKTDITECSFFSNVEDLQFELGSQSIQQSDCYLAIYNSLFSNIELNYYFINRTDILDEGVYLLVKDLLLYIEIKDLSYSTEDRFSFIQEKFNNFNNYTEDALGFFQEFPSCRDYLADDIDNGTEEFSLLLNEPLIDIQEECLFEAFTFMNNSYQEFYTKTGYVIPNNISSFNLEIKDLMFDFMSIVNDNNFNQSMDSLNCLPENKNVYNIYFGTEISLNESLLSYVENNIPSCSESVLSQDISYVENSLDIYFIYSEGDKDPSLYSSALETCHLDLINEMSSSEILTKNNIKKGQFGVYDFMNKVEVGTYLDTIAKYDNGICEVDGEPQLTTIIKNIYESDGFSIYLKDGLSSKELYFGLKKNNVNVSLDYLGFTGNTVKKTSLISGDKEDFIISNIILENQLEDDNSVSDFILIPDRLSNASQAYSKIESINSENVLSGVFILNNDMKMEEVSFGYQGKIIVYNGSLIFTTFSSELGYYFYEVSN
jgi:hypothetical protein